MDNSLEIFCPVCKMKNEASAIFCVQCQSPLSTHEVSKKTTKLMGGDTKMFDTDEIYEDIGIPKKGIAIVHQESGQQIGLELANKFFLGRKTEEVREALLDLSPFGAYGLGVSRHHASVQKTRSGYTLTDLNSTNGTWVDNEQLQPNQAYPISSGAHIRLGKMQIIVLFGKNPQ